MPDDDRSRDLIQPSLPTLRQPGAGARLLAFRPWDRPGSLRGHADIDFSGWQLFRIPIFVRADNSLSVGAPSAPEIDGDGRHRIGEDGKRLYWPLVRFRDRDARVRWEKAVLGALDAAGVSP